LKGKGDFGKGMSSADQFARWELLAFTPVALGSFAVAIVALRRRRARLSVTWTFAAPSYAIIAINTGLTPVTTKWLLLYIGKEKPQPFPSDSSFEARLEPSERTSVKCPASAAVRLAEARKITLLDSEGREWPLRKFKRFKSHWSILQAEIY
jgi:hypothetical protein